MIDIGFYVGRWHCGLQTRMCRFSYRPLVYRRMICWLGLKLWWGRF